MKLIKKLTTILFAFMMVLSATTMVFAADTGKITINNAIPGQEYKIYKILELESYDPTSGLYAYKLTSNDWKDFIKNDTEGQKYLEIVDEDMGIVKKTTLFTDETAKDFAKAALNYVKTHTTIIPTDSKVAPAATGGTTTSTVEFTNLDMGYYLVDSSAGVLCSLNTLSADVTIQEKNIAPTVKKEVSYDATNYHDKVSADIGGIAWFKTTITVGEGAENYVLHDKETNGLKIVDSTFQVIYDGATKNAGDFYEIVTDAASLTDGCTFHIKFLKSNELVAGKEIVVSYHSKVTEDAEILTENNKNTAWVVYGNNNAESNSDTAIVKTYQIPLYKFGKNANDDTVVNLAGAKFKLTTSTNIDIKLIRIDDNTYRRGDAYEVYANGVTEFVTPTNGKITIKGLVAGTYYLTETVAPSGYNKLNKPIEITIDENGGVTYKEQGAAGTGTDITTTENLVKIENRTGVVLPSTGGVGTTMMYIVGAALLIGSGVLLITKKNAK